METPRFSVHTSERPTYWKRTHIEHGQHYDKNKKEKFIAFLKDFDQNEGLGDILVDVGCGPTPLSRQFPDRARIEIDVSKKRSQEKRGIGLLEIAADVETLFTDDGKPRSDIEQMLGFIKETGAKSGTYLVSDLLNYIDWRKLFLSLDQILPTDWQIAINNRVNYGPEEALHEKRPQSSDDVRDFFIHELGYQLVAEDSLSATAQEPDHEAHTWFIYRKLAAEE
jgi:hypothetical protein